MTTLHPNFRTDYDHFQGSPIAPIELIEYGDFHFENQRHLTRVSFSRFARDIQLDIGAFEDCREHRKLIRKVVGDFEGGLKGGVISSPTLFINGLRYEGFTDFDTLYLALKYANHPEFRRTSSRAPSF